MGDKKEGVELYTIRKDVICLSCESSGAVQHYGNHYPKGLGENTYLPQYKEKPYMSMAMGLGGTIPYQCINCNRFGLIDFGGLEGYQQQFKSNK